MKLGIVISTNSPEEVWNAFRLGVTALKENHEVKVFLVNSGVEAESITSEKYDIGVQIDQFVENKGHIMACGTCLKSRREKAISVLFSSGKGSEMRSIFEKKEENGGLLFPEYNML